MAPPTPGLDPVADAATLPPPDLRVPALAPPSLPSLSGAPVVPPTPRFSLDEEDADLTQAADHGASELPTAPSCPSITEPVPATSEFSLAAAFDPQRVEIVQLSRPEATPRAAAADAVGLAPGLPEFAASPAVSDAPAAPVIPADPLPTTEFPAVQSDALSPANEPLGAPPQVAMVMPSLPTLAAAAPVPAPAPADGGPTLHQPSQAAIAYVAPVATSDAPGGRSPQSAPAGNPGRSVARTLGAVVLAGVVGLGAHLGYDWWETRDTTAVAGVAVDGTDLASWPQVDPPAIRYTDSVTTFSTEAGTRTLTAHREISSGMTQANVVTTDPAGVVVSETGLDIRGEQAFVRLTPDAPWALTPTTDAVAQLGDTWTADVYTVREFFPAEAMPYIIVLESVERLLPVKPLQPAADLGQPGAAPIAISTEPTSMAWQYRVIIDIEAFRANESIIFQEWQRRIGRAAVPRMEAWVDNSGIVRQFTVDVDGTKVTHTLVGGAAASTRFDTNPLLDPAPADVETALPAPIEPEAGG